MMALPGKREHGGLRPAGLTSASAGSTQVGISGGDFKRKILIIQDPKKYKLDHLLLSLKNGKQLESYKMER
jgi:hypothetical protein